jgi:hypothetical protein
MSLRDCVRMSEIAAEMMSQAKIDDTPLNFAVFHLAGADASREGIRCSLARHADPTICYR